MKSWAKTLRIVSHLRQRKLLYTYKYICDECYLGYDLSRARNYPNYEIFLALISQKKNKPIVS